MRRKACIWITFSNRWLEWANFVSCWCKSEPHVVSHSVTNASNFRLSSNLWSQRFCYIAGNRWQTLRKQQTSHITVTEPKLGSSLCKTCTSVVSVVSTFHSSFPVRPQVKLTRVLVATKWSRCTVKLPPIFPASMSCFMPCTRHVQRDVNITAVRYAAKILLKLRVSMA
jgi:hypothetical protein